MSAPLTLREVAAMVGGSLSGNPDHQVTGVSDLRFADPSHISFLANRRYRKAAIESNAGAIIVPMSTVGEFKAPLIRVENPTAAFTAICQHFAAQPPPRAEGIHPSAFVASSANIAPDATVGPHAVVEAGATIGRRTFLGAGSYIGHGTTVGEDCTLHPRAVVLHRCILGNRVNIHSGAVIGSDGFGYDTSQGRHLRIQHTGIVQIDDDVEIGANTVVDRGRFDRTWIQVGVKIDALVMIAHNVVIGPHTIIVALSGLAGSCHIGSHVTIAGQVGIGGHLTIGDRATITARAAVSKDCQPGITYSGQHARPMHEWMRVEAAVHRLPELIERLRNLESGGTSAS